ncbi:uncharacterized protein LOC108086491 [Drosophila ficusphila]|uniref:uncharacterized protein LOC108086491 n=1 Tax=Drosophila ficusphila TaxID=30025 RepID=UPI0007E8636F|nr:uncharacterized protein LOC108086491 [Drosophila ficusphila]
MSQTANLPELSYTPGDFTEPQFRLPSHQQLLDQSRQDSAEDIALRRLTLDTRDTQPIKYREQLGSSAGRQFPALAAAQNRYADHLERNSDLSFSVLDHGKDLISLPTVGVPQLNPNPDPTPDLIKKMPLHSITEKPNERCPSPVVPAYANFELAKRMHQDNLDHQPLPDCVADLAFRRAQISGGHAGLALEIDPIATGVGVKTHNAGPTHCTKMKVFRPKTGGGIVPRALGNGDPFRGVGSAPAKKMGPMDLAICWDFKPANPADEPRLARHIDGSNDSAGPAVFTCVKTPREEQSSDLGRSAGVFTSTLGEADFFDKDILRKRTDFGGARLDREDPCACDYSPPSRQRARSVSRDSSASAAHCRRGSSGLGGPNNGGVSFGNLAAELPGRGMPDRLAKQYQSSPLLGDKTYQALREKYLGPDSGQDCQSPMNCRPSGGPPCKRDVLLRRPARRLCHKVAPAPRCCPPSFGGHGGHGHGHCLTSKAAFRAGVPKHNATGDFVGLEHGCGGGGAGRVLVVPRPRQPYSKKNYDIETLVPPFQSQAGGAGQGGYPEHWRLASVYQHAYKPIDQRRRPLLQTVYK